MIYQVRSNLFFDEEDEARDFYHDCILAFAKARDCNPHTTNTEFSLIELIENHHETNPHGPCDCIERMCSNDVTI